MIDDMGEDPNVEMTNEQGNANHPIYVPDSQESAFPPHPALTAPINRRQLIPGLEWKTVT